MEIRLLEPDDHRAGFRSGDPADDYFFANFADYMPNFVGSTYVAVAGRRILGFLTALNADLAFGQKTLPVLRISRLTVDLSARGHGIARALLAAAVRQLRQPGQSVVIDTPAPGFFARYGFETIDLAEGQLGVRPLRTIVFLPASLLGDVLP